METPNRGRVLYSIAYGLEVRWVPKDGILQRVAHAAEVLDLTAMLKLSVVDLSGGEQQRIALALALADRIGVMARGRLQQIGTPEQLLDAPANLFAAGFVGSPPMNLISGEVTIDESGYQVVAPGLRVALSPEWKPVLGAYGTRPGGRCALDRDRG